MAKKLPSKKKLTPKNHEEVQSSVVVEKNNYGEKETLLEKGAVQDEDTNPVNMLQEGKAIVGLSKGLTINLGNYESAKIMCWISRVTKDDEQSIMNNLVEISEMLDEQIQFEADELAQDRQ